MTGDEIRVGLLRNKVVMLLALKMSPARIVEIVGKASEEGGNSPLDEDTIMMWSRRYRWTKEHLDELASLIADHGADAQIVVQKAAELAMAGRPGQRTVLAAIEKVGAHIDKLTGKQIYETGMAKVRHFQDMGIKAESKSPDAPDEPSARTAPVLFHKGDIIVRRSDDEEVEIEGRVVGDEDRKGDE